MTQPAKSQVIFNIESVGKSTSSTTDSRSSHTLDRFQSNALYNPTTPHVALEFSSPPITPPSPSMSIATSLPTDAPLSSHGIVGPCWKNCYAGKIFNAFSKSQTAESLSIVPALADSCKGFHLSASGSDRLAWTFSLILILVLDAWRLIAGAIDYLSNPPLFFTSERLLLRLYFMNTGCHNGKYQITLNFASMVIIYLTLGCFTIRPTASQSLAVTDYYNCYITPNTSLDCQGFDSTGAGLTIPSDLVGFVQIVGGSNHACGLLSTGAVYCFGDNTYGQSTPPASLQFTYLAATYTLTCGIITNGSVVCFGDVRQLNRAPWVGESISGFNSQAGPSGFKHIALGGIYLAMCGVRLNGTIVCIGQLSPTGLTSNQYIQVTMGESDVCGLLSTGSIQCVNGFGGAVTNPPPAGLCATSLSNASPISSSLAGVKGPCAISCSGQIICWDGGPTLTPPTSTTVKFSQVVLGMYVCGIDQNGRIWSQFYADQSASISNLNVVADIHSSCITWINQTIHCFDSSGNRIDSFNLPPANMISRFSAFAFSGSPSRVFAVGINSTQQLVLFPTTTHTEYTGSVYIYVPPNVYQLRIIDVILSYVSCVVTFNGTVSCWNLISGLYTGTGPSSLGSLLPQSVPFTRITIFPYGICGLSTNGTMFCGGYDSITGNWTTQPFGSAIAFKSFASQVNTYSIVCGLDLNDHAHCYCLMTSQANYLYLVPTALTTVEFSELVMFSSLKYLFRICGLTVLDQSIYCWGGNVADSVQYHLVGPFQGLMGFTNGDFGLCFRKVLDNSLQCIEFRLASDFLPYFLRQTIGGLAPEYYYQSGSQFLTCPFLTLSSISGSTTQLCDGPCTLDDPACIRGCPITYYCQPPLQTICPLGAYCPQDTFGSPLPCPIGSYGNSTGLGTNICSGPCPPGYLCNWGTVYYLDVPCPGGYYCPDVSTLLSIICPIGQYGSPGSSTSNCTGSCPSGFFCSAGTIDYHDRPCPVAFYCPVEATLAPIRCPPGSYCPLGSIQPLPCDAGTYGPIGDYSLSTCAGLCPKGYLCPNGTVIYSQFPCPSGQYCPIAGTLVAIICEPGYWCPSLSTSGHQIPCGSNSVYCPMGSSLPSAILPGFYANDSADGTPLTFSSQVPCDVGHYCDGSGLLKTCIAGTFQPHPNSTSCIVCPTGSYSGISSTTCQTCLAGTYTYDPSVPCITCPAGKYSLNSSTICVPCPSGSYSNISSSGCHTCLRGTYAADTSIRCQNCTAGRYSLDSASTCTPCGSSSVFCPIGSSSVIPISSGYYGTNSTDGTSNTFSSQAPCDIGHYCDGSGLMKSCSAGTYQPNQASASCFPCSSGSFSTPGSPTCQVCLGGAYTDDTSKPCINCVPGKYSLDSASTCLPCPPGSYSSVSSSMCYACQPGTYTYDTTIPCMNCTAGKYSLDSSSSTCTQCPIGRASNGVGVNQPCLECVNGTYADQVGMVHCSPCLPPNYNPSPTVCLYCKETVSSDYRSCTSASCPKNTQYDPVDHNCVTCPLGQYSLASTCQSCPPNTYTPHAGYDCISCEQSGMIGLVCVDGLANVTAGYWAYRDYDAVSGTDIFYTVECPTGFCSGGALQAIELTNRTSTTSSSLELDQQSIQCQFPRLQSADNYLCGACADGYLLWNNECHLCEKSNGGLVFLSLLLSFALVLFLFRSSSSDSSSVSTGLVVILIYFVQIGALEVTDISRYFNWYTIMNFHLQSLSGSGQSSCIAPIQPTEQVVLELLTPMILIIELGIICLIHRLLHRYHHRIISQQSVNNLHLHQPNSEFHHAIHHQMKSVVHGVISTFDYNKYIGGVFSILLFCYTLVAESCISWFSCITINADTRVLFRFPNIDCSSSEYHSMLGWVLFVFLTYIIGLPLIMFVFLKRNRRFAQRHTQQIQPNQSQIQSDAEMTVIEKSLDSNTIYSDSTIHADLPSEHLIFIRRFGCLFRMYHQSAWYWQTVVLFRRLLLVTIHISLLRLPSYRFLCFSLVNIFSMLIIIHIKPFGSKYVNMMDVISHIALLLISQLLTLLPPYPMSVQTAILLLLILPTCLLIIALIKQFWLKRQKKSVNNNTSAGEENMNEMVQIDTEAMKKSPSAPIIREPLSHDDDMTIDPVHDTKLSFVPHAPVGVNAWEESQQSQLQRPVHIDQMIDTNLTDISTIPSDIDSSDKGTFVTQSSDAL